MPSIQTPLLPKDVPVRCIAAAGNEAPDSRGRSGGDRGRGDHRGGDGAVASGGGVGGGPHDDDSAAVLAEVREAREVAGVGQDGEGGRGLLGGREGHNGEAGACLGTFSSAASLQTRPIIIVDSRTFQVDSLRAVSSRLFECGKDDKIQ